jgi:hypothetical protein
MERAIPTQSKAWEMVQNKYLNMGYVTLLKSDKKMIFENHRKNDTVIVKNPYVDLGLEMVSPEGLVIAGGSIVTAAGVKAFLSGVGIASGGSATGAAAYTVLPAMVAAVGVAAIYKGAKSLLEKYQGESK